MIVDQMMFQHLALKSLVLLLGLVSGCREASPKDGVFFGETHFEKHTENYSLSKTEAEKILQEHCEKTGEKYRYFPYQVVFATKGGYLFVDGEFKLKIRAVGYYVDEHGEVAWRDLGWSIDVRDYTGNKEKE